MCVFSFTKCTSFSNSLRSIRPSPLTSNSLKICWSYPIKWTNKRKFVNTTKHWNAFENQLYKWMYFLFDNLQHIYSEVFLDRLWHNLRLHRCLWLLVHSTRDPLQWHVYSFVLSKKNNNKGNEVSQTDWFLFQNKMETTKKRMEFLCLCICISVCGFVLWWLNEFDVRGEGTRNFGTQFCDEWMWCISRSPNTHTERNFSDRNFGSDIFTSDFQFIFVNSCDGGSFNTSHFFSIVIDGHICLKKTIDMNWAKLNFMIAVWNGMILILRTKNLWWGLHSLMERS